VVVNYALKKGLLEEAYVASYAKVFFKPFVQAQATAHSQFSTLQAFL